MSTSTSTAINSLFRKKLLKCHLRWGCRCGWVWAGAGCASLFVVCCFIVLIKHSNHLRFAVLLALALTHDAKCQAYGTDTNLSAQQANQLANLALTDLMNLAASFRSTLNTKPDAQRATAHHNQHDEQRHTQRMWRYFGRSAYGILFYLRRWYVSRTPIQVAADTSAWGSQ